MAVHNLSTIKKLISDYIKELENYGVRVEKVILYGSCARGTATKYSDIDIVIISKSLARWKPIERLQMLSRATENVDAPLEVIGYTPQEIKRRGKRSIFWDEITRDGVEIFKRAA